MEAYKCLYTKHLVKKRKTWEDGFVICKGDTVTLHDAEGRQLQEGIRLPVSSLASADGPLKDFAGLLVTVEEPCGPHELPGALADAAHRLVGAANPSPLNAVTKTPGAALTVSQQARAPVQRSVVPVLGRRSAQQFMPPKPLKTQAGSGTSGPESQLKACAEPRAARPAAQQRHPQCEAPQTGREPLVTQGFTGPCNAPAARSGATRSTALSEQWTLKRGPEQGDPGPHEPCLRRWTGTSDSYGPVVLPPAPGPSVSSVVPAAYVMPEPCTVGDTTGPPTALRTDDDILALLALDSEPPPECVTALPNSNTGGGFGGTSFGRGPGSGSCSGVLEPEVRHPLHPANAGCCEVGLPSPNGEYWQGKQHPASWTGSFDHHQQQQQQQQQQPESPQRRRPCFGPSQPEDSWGALDVDMADPDDAACWDSRRGPGGGPGAGAGGRGGAGVTAAVQASRLPTDQQVLSARRRWGLDNGTTTAPAAFSAAAAATGSYAGGALPAAHAGIQRTGHHGLDVPRRGPEAVGTAPAGLPTRANPGPSGIHPAQARPALHNAWEGFVGGASLEGFVGGADGAGGDGQLADGDQTAAAPWHPVARAVAAPGVSIARPRNRGGGAAPAAPAAVPPPNTAGTGTFGGQVATDANAPARPGLAERVAVARARWAARQDTSVQPTGPGGASSMGARVRCTSASSGTEDASVGGDGIRQLPGALVGRAASSRAATSLGASVTATSAWSATAAAATAATAAAAGAGVGRRGGPAGQRDGGFDGLALPPLDQPAVPRRLVAIPAGFTGIEHYRTTMVSALVEEVNLRLAEPVQQLYGIVRRLLGPAPATSAQDSAQQQQKQQQHQQRQLGHPQAQHTGKAAAGSGTARNGTREFVRLPPSAQAAELERACQPCHVPYFATCTLTCWVNRDGGGSGGGGGGGKKKKRRDRDEAAEDGHDGAGEPPEKATLLKVSYYLIIPSARSRLKSTRRYDLWIISSHPLLQGGGMGPGCGPSARTGQAGGWRALCRSLWHGPDRDGKFEVEMLTAPPPGNVRSQAVYALRGPDVQSEVQMVQLLEGLGCAGTRASAGSAPASAPSRFLPIMRHLLGLQPPDPQLDLASTSASVPHAAGAAAPGSGVPFKRPRMGAPQGEVRHGAQDGNETGEEGLAADQVGVDFDPGAIARAHARRFGLNGDQAAVLLHCASWFKPHRGRTSPAADGKGAGGGTGTNTGGGTSSGWIDSDDDESEDEGDDDDGGEGCGVDSGGGEEALPAGGRVARRGGRRLRSGGGSDREAVRGRGPGWGVDGAGDDNGDDEEEDEAFVGQGSHAGRRDKEAGSKAAAGLKRGRRRRRVVEDDGEAKEEDEDGGGDGDKGGGVRREAWQRSNGADAVAVAAEGGAEPSPLKSQPPVCLVHGPFGSGKSSLLVALILMLVELGRQQQRALAAAAAAAADGGRGGRGRKPAVTAAGGPGAAAPLVRVLLASHTNVAVDRVLIGLQDTGFTDFLRLGSVDRIAKPVLHRSLRSGEGDSKDTATELRRALKDARTPSDVAYIEAELAALAAGAEKQRRRALRTCPVVGATVCSLLQPSSEDGCGGSFTVVVLDECSQMTEPLSLVPLLRAKARYLVAAGDPLQLPPVIANPASLTCPPQGLAPPQQPLPHDAGAAGQGRTGAVGPLDSLLRPLFVRLSQLGHQPHLLSYQYRCHPLLSGIANAAFYRGRLKDGCTAADRPPLLSGLPTLLFVETQGQTQVDSFTRSSYNTAEAHVIARAVGAMLERGVDPDDVGVICFYRAQVNAIRTALQAQAAAAGSVGPAGAGAAAARPPSHGGQPPRGRAAVASGGDGDDEDGGEGQQADEAGGGRGEGRQREGGVQVATVDSFQGAEKDVIILATTVSRAADFAADTKRLNVALTRGRRHLLVVGSPSALSNTSAVFKDIIRTCQDAMRPATQGGPGHAAAGGLNTGPAGTGPASDSALYVSAAGLHRLLGAGAGGPSGAPRGQPAARPAEEPQAQWLQQQQQQQQQQQHQPQQQQHHHHHQPQQQQQHHHQPQQQQQQHHHQPQQQQQPGLHTQQPKPVPMPMPHQPMLMPRLHPPQAAHPGLKQASCAWQQQQQQQHLQQHPPELGPVPVPPPLGASVPPSSTPPHKGAPPRCEPAPSGLPGLTVAQFPQQQQQLPQQHQPQWRPPQGAQQRSPPLGLAGPVGGQGEQQRALGYPHQQQPAAYQDQQWDYPVGQSL